MNKFCKVGGVFLCAIVSGALLTACQGNGSTNSSAALSTGAKVLPVASNPIQNNSTVSGLIITNAMAENNIDPATNQPIPDCLQLELRNTANQPMNSFEIYYKMTDSKTGAAENYYQRLPGLSLAPGQTTTIFFDNQKSAGHYPENKYSIYRTSSNEVRFTIELSTPGFKPAFSQAIKGPGTGENSSQ